MEHKNDVKKMEQLKPKRPTIPNHLVAHQQLKNSPRRRRKVVRSKAKTSTNHQKLEHGIRQKHSTGNENITREAISIEQVKTLGTLFEKDGLKEEDFIREIRKYIPSLSEHQVTELFLKIDANADGRVDWDELTSYMFVHSSDARCSSVFMHHKCVICF